LAPRIKSLQPVRATGAPNRHFATLELRTEIRRSPLLFGAGIGGITKPPGTFPPRSPAIPMPFLSSDLLAALPRLRRYARLLIDDPALADDIVKQTLSRARHILNEPPSGMTPAMQLLSVLRSVYADQVAQGRLRGPMSPHDTRELNSQTRTDSLVPAPGSNAVRTEVVLTQLFRLPIEQREVLVLVAIECMSYQDIATLLAVPVATVSARLTQAREALHSVEFKSQAAPNGAN
jgi:RNA polymerase sigma-70 factor (ECF subfamily)